MRNKSTIAKLLSEEDINVVQKQATTASFDVKNRELVLPIWKDEMSDNIADLLVCHEIGHALYTSENMLNEMIERKIEKTFVNVIEDARIEKMVQQKYAGSRSVFLKGYKELIDKDFFGTKDKDISKMNLIDRINLYYKGTSDTPFAEQEKIWVKKVGNVKTEDDVLNLAEELYKWMQENKESQGEEPEQGQESQSSAGSETSQEQSQSSGSEESTNNDSGQTQSQGSNNEEGDEEQDGSTAQLKQDSEETEGTQEIITNGQEGGQSQGEEFTATTDTSYNNKFNEVRDIDAKDRNYSFIPKVKLDKAIISPKEIFEICRKHYKITEATDSNHVKFISSTTEELKGIKNDSKKVISYMVKEFEMKKSADLYKRATVSKTGSLNMGALHSYKFNEDLFAKVTTMPGATNHAMVMFLDWSGSMADNLPQTLKQLFNLVWFCNRVKIPFEVYAFTDAWNGSRYYGNEEGVTKIQDFKSGDMIINDVKLLNYLSSKMNKNDQDEMMDYLWKMCQAWVGFRDWRNDGYPITPPKKLTLGGTPLNHAIVTAMDILPKYKKETGVQRLNTVFLTDGYSHTVQKKYVVIDDKKTDDYVSSTFVQSVVTDPITNTTIIQESNSGFRRRHVSQTTMLLKLLKKRVPDMNILGFFIAGSGRKGYVKKDIIMEEMNCSWEEAGTYLKEINKNKVLVNSKKEGYDEHYLMPGGEKLDIESGDLDVEVGASKANLKRAFVKASKGKVTSRVLLNKFIQMVA